MSDKELANKLHAALEAAWDYIRARNSAMEYNAQYAVMEHAKKLYDEAMAELKR